MKKKANKNILICVVIILLLIDNAYTFTTTIAGGYANRPDTCMFLTPDPLTTYPLVTTHWGEVSGDGNPSDSVIIQIWPSYNFSGSFGAGAVYPPNKVTIPWPYCGSSGFMYSPITLQPDWPTPTTAGCEGRLLYGWEGIPLIPQDNSIGFNNSIIGKSAGRLDVQYPSQSKGTVTYFRPDNASCPTPNVLTFRVLLNTTGLNDIDDVTPIAYQDSASGITKYCPVYGLGCGLVPRPVDSLRYNPRITVTPVCKQVMPFVTGYNVGDYEDMMGGPNRIGPANVNLSAIVYLIKVDNLPPPLAIYVRLLFDYVAGTTPEDTIVGPFYVDQTTVYYVPSIGTNPAIVRVQYYSDSQPFVETWSEVKLSYLDRCYCSTDNSTVPNILCDNAPEPNMISNFTRNDIPNYNAMPNDYIDAPTCVFYINNGDPVYQNILFNVESYVVSDEPATIIYLWEIGGTPAENVVIATPTLPDTDITISIVGLVTVNLTVFLDGYNPPRIRKCSQKLQVYNGAPTPSLTPLTAIIPLATLQTLDGSGSTSPPGFGVIQWTWTITLGPQGGGTLSTTTGSMTDFSATITGVYIVTMQVCNNVACNSSLSAVINAGFTPTPAVPPVACFNESNPPFNFTVPITPAPSPVGPGPGSPFTPTPIGHGGIIGPAAAIPPGTAEALNFVAILIAVLLVLIGLALGIRRAVSKRDVNIEREQRKYL